jgi:hypothetical protein
MRHAFGSKPKAQRVKTDVAKEGVCVPRRRNAPHRGRTTKEQQQAGMIVRGLAVQADNVVTQYDTVAHLVIPEKRGSAAKERGPGAALVDCVIAVSVAAHKNDDNHENHYQ